MTDVKRNIIKLKNKITNIRKKKKNGWAIRVRGRNAWVWAAWYSVAQLQLYMKCFLSKIQRRWKGGVSSGDGKEETTNRKAYTAATARRRWLAAGLGYYPWRGRSSSRVPSSIVFSDDDHWNTHRNQKKKTKECCCLLGEAVRRMLRLCEIGQGDDRRGENERKKTEISKRPTRKPVAFVAVKWWMTE